MTHKEQQLGKPLWNIADQLRREKIRRVIMLLLFKMLALDGRINQDSI
jgi:hypothetical protein